MASREASGTAGEEEVVVAEEVPEESRTPEVQEEALTPEEILEGDQDNPQEVERLKIAPDPGQPTRQQLAEHRITHVPFRSWCKWCVMGRARGTPHAPSGGSAIPIIGLDYFFITRGGVKNRSELDFPATEEGSADLEVARETGEIVKCIVLRCSKSKIVLAHVVPCKGLDEDEYVLNTVVNDLAWLGYTAMIIKGDNGRALQALLRE